MGRGAGAGLPFHWLGLSPYYGMLAIFLLFNIKCVKVKNTGLQLKQLSKNILFVSSYSFVIALDTV